MTAAAASSLSLSRTLFHTFYLSPFLPLWLSPFSLCLLALCPCLVLWLKDSTAATRANFVDLVSQFLFRSLPRHTLYLSSACPCSVCVSCVLQIIFMLPRFGMCHRKCCLPHFAVRLGHRMLFAFDFRDKYNDWWKRLLWQKLPTAGREIYSREKKRDREIETARVSAKKKTECCAFNRLSSTGISRDCE